MARSQRAAKSIVIEVRCLISRTTDRRQADNEEVIVDEDQVLRPTIASRIEEAICSPTRAMRNLLPLG